MEKDSVEIDEVERFRKKKILVKLRDAQGNGTSMISLVIPPKDQISRLMKLLLDEQGTASNIKSKVNKLSVLKAISLAMNKLKTLSKIPANGLGLYVGEAVSSADGKVRKVSHAIEPVKPVNTSLYMCDSKFYVEDLLKLFEDDTRYGFVIADGHGALFATLQGNNPTILQQISEHLPKKHGRGGQSAMRFARLRVEKREAYVKKINEIITKLFITDSHPNVSGLIIGGNTYLKNDITKALDKRLNLIKVVDINYCGKRGLEQAIDLSAEALKEVRFAKEKKVLKDFLYEVHLDTGKYCYGYKATMEALEAGAVETLILYENSEMRILDDGDEELVDWMTENYKNFGCKLVLISDKSSEGSQFVEGFGGFGGILRYQLEFTNYEDDELSSLSSLSNEEDEIF